MICIFLFLALVLTILSLKLGFELTDIDYVILAILLVADVIWFKGEKGRRER